MKGRIPPPTLWRSMTRPVVLRWTTLGGVWKEEMNGIMERMAQAFGTGVAIGAGAAGAAMNGAASKVGELAAEKAVAVALERSPLKLVSAADIAKATEEAQAANQRALATGGAVGLAVGGAAGLIVGVGIGRRQGAGADASNVVDFQRKVG